MKKGVEKTTDYSEEIIARLEGVDDEFANKAAELINRLGGGECYHASADVDDGGMVLTDSSNAETLVKPKAGSGLSFEMRFWKGEHDDYSAAGGVIDVYPLGKEFRNLFGKDFVKLFPAESYDPKTKKWTTIHDGKWGELDLVAFAKADKKRYLSYQWETKGAYEDLRHYELIEVKDGAFKSYRKKTTLVENQEAKENE